MDELNADYSERVVVSTARLEWEPSPSPTVWRKRLERIGRAGRLEPAGVAQPGLEQQAVGDQREDSGGIGDEVLRAQVSLALSDPARLPDILPDMPGAGVAALPSYAAVMPNARLRYAQNRPDIRDDPMAPIRPSPLAGASNAWAAAPSRSTSGGTLLANDPHLGLTAPSIWYLARLELGTGGVIGGTIPGLPAILVGRSDAIAWGVTSSYLDDLDVYMEEINPANPEEYRTPTGWARFESRPSIIQVKGSEPVTLTLRWTENGPVLPGTHYDLDTVTPAGHVVMSVSATSLVFLAGLGLLSARAGGAPISIVADFTK